MTALATPQPRVEGPTPLRFDFPLPRPHTGVALANGVQGLLVWGEGELHLTVGRTGFWDRRGGNHFWKRIRYATLRDLLRTGREEEVRRIFRDVGEVGGDAGLEPSQISGGRVTLCFPEGMRPAWAELDLPTARLAIGIASDSGADHRLTVWQAVDGELACIDVPPALRTRIGVTCRPA